jgi:acyl-coenzyme A synthetase/AMP-(fatty) acid ligase
LAGLGVVKGDRVSFFMGNRPELAALYLACFRLGAVGIPDGAHGQAVLALIVPREKEDPPNMEELAAFAEERLAERKVPRRWALVDEIPLTPMAKIDRKALAAMADKILADENQHICCLLNTAGIL